MNLHVVAYPELAPTDFELIQRCRKEHNSLYSMIGPHFTIVFSVQDMAFADFSAEVKRQIADTTQILFCFRGVVLNKDSFSNYYDAFLVPDEGFSKVVKLHDRIYSNKLSPHHRLDISYIPHLSIASSTDVTTVKRIVDKWNEKEFAINGVISSLDIINYENRVITTVEKIQLPLI